MKLPKRLRAAAFVGLSMAALALPSLPGPAAAPAQAADPKPNILIILTDDQPPDTMMVMPKTMKFFGNGGTNYPNGSVSTPLCCPSRSSIFSGRYAHNHGVHTNENPGVGPAVDQGATMQKYLHDAGYQTAIDGKMLNNWGYRNNPPNWDHWALFQGGNNNTPEDGYFDSAFNVDGTIKTVPGYTTDVLGSEAVKFLNDFGQQPSKPWLLYVATQAPHAPFHAAPKYDGSSVPPWAGDPAVFESDKSDKPPWSHQGYTYAKGVALRQEQLNTLKSVDDMVGKITKKLKATGQAQNTLAVFMSDNGFLWGQHSIGADKRWPYLPSIQVPFLARWPGHIAAGATDDRIVAGLDLLPTILDATGISPTLKYPLDGRSFLSSPPRKRMLYEYWRSPDKPSIPGWAATLTPTYEYIEWYDDDMKTITFREYYDLTTDPYQLVNLFKDGTKADDPPLSPLHKRLTKDRSCIGPACP
jgi:arylsulfatase A-like enzyme